DGHIEHWRGSPSPKCTTSLISLRLIASDSAWRTSLLLKNSRSAGFLQVRLGYRMSLTGVVDCHIYILRSPLSTRLWYSGSSLRADWRPYISTSPADRRANEPSALPTM